MAKKASKAKKPPAKAGKPVKAAKAKMFEAWCIYRVDGDPSVVSTSRKVSVASIRTGRQPNADAVSEGNWRIPDGAPHRAERVYVVPATGYKITRTRGGGK